MITILENKLFNIKLCLAITEADMAPYGIGKPFYIIITEKGDQVITENDSLGNVLYQYSQSIPTLDIVDLSSVTGDYISIHDVIKAYVSQNSKCPPAVRILVGNKTNGFQSITCLFSALLSDDISSRGDLILLKAPLSNVFYPLYFDDKMGAYASHDLTLAQILANIKIPDEYLQSKSESNIMMTNSRSNGEEGGDQNLIQLLNLNLLGRVGFQSINVIDGSQLIQKQVNPEDLEGKEFNTEDKTNP